MQNSIPPHLRWACRRGMLELDVLLRKFLDHAYLSLSEEDKQLFQELLDCNDQELFVWLTGKESAKSANLQYMVDKVRENARNQH